MAGEPKFEGDVTVRSVNWLGALGWMAAVIFGSSWLVAHATIFHASHLVFGLFVLVLGIGYGVKLFARNRSERPAKAVIDARGVTIDDELVLAASEISPGAYLSPLEHGRTSIRLRTHHPFRSLELGIATEAEGEQILEALGQDPARAKVRFRLAGGFENKTMRQVATVVIGLSTSCGGFVNGNSEVFHVLFVLWALALAVAGISFLLPTYVTVGSDGLYIERRARRRFVPFTSVRGVDRDPEHPDALRITLASEEIVLRTTIRDRANMKESELIARRALETRIEKSLAAFRARAHEIDASLLLKRGGRSVKEWMEALEKLRLERGYRDTHVTDDQLWAVLEDPAASAEDRAAALVALRGTADDAGKARQRVALEASAEPRLRVVLAAAEKEDAGALEAALDELREDEPATEKA